MNALQSRYRDLRILAVPCNQFGLQEPGDNGTEILNCLKYVRPGSGFVPSFPLTEKIKVNGLGEHPMYSFLKRHCSSPVTSFAPKDQLDYDGLFSADIRWNFEKFLVDKSGRPVARYSRMYLSTNIASDIDSLLSDRPNRRQN